MFGFDWVAALILLGLLAAIGWLVRRAFRRPIQSSRRSSDGDSRDVRGTQSLTPDHADWATQVLDHGRAAKRRDRGQRRTSGE